MAEALNESLILGLFAGRGVDPPFVAAVGDIGPEGVPIVPVLVDARRSVSIAEAETGGEVASGEGTEGAEEPVKDGMLRNGGIPGGGGIIRLDAVGVDVATPRTPATDAVAGDPGGGGERAGEGIAAELPPGGLNSA